MPSVKKNLFYNLLLLFSNLLFPVVNFAYASRILGPIGIGKVQFVITFASYFVVIAQLGIPAYGMREIAKAKNDRKRLDKLFSELFVINLISSLLLLSAYMGVIMTINWFRNSLDYYLLAGLLVFSGFSVLEWFYRGMEKFRFLTIRSVVIKTVALTGLLLFVKTPEDLMIYFLLTMGSTLTINLWNIAGLRGKVVIRFKDLKLKRHFNALLILFASSLTIAVYTVGDTLLLGFFSGDKAVGLYTVAKKLILITIPLITSLGTVLIPRMAQSLDMKDKNELQRRVNQSFAFVSFLGVPASIGLIAFAPEIIVAFSGKQFTGAIVTLQLIAPTIFMVGLGYLFGKQLLIQGGYEKLYLKATVYGMVISLVLDLILISRYQDKGAAATLLVVETLVSMVSWNYVRRKMKIQVHWWQAFQALVASLLFFPVAFELRNIHILLIPGLLVAVAVSACLYLLVQLFVFREPMVWEVLNWKSIKFKRSEAQSSKEKVQGKK